MLCTHLQQIAMWGHFVYVTVTTINEMASVNHFHEFPMTTAESIAFVEFFFPTDILDIL